MNISKEKNYYDTDSGIYKVEVFEKKQYQYDLTYSFNVGFAEKYGVNEAIVINNLVFWIKRNIANKKNYHDGYYWTYNSVAAFKKLFPFWSKDQIRRIFEKLEKRGIIKSGIYNKAAYDRTKWYTIIAESILRFHKIETAETLNQISEFAEPIPDNKTDNKPDNINDVLINNVYNSYPTKCPNTGRSLSKSAKDKTKIKALLKEKTEYQLIETIKKYVEESTTGKFKPSLKNFSTFLNNLPDYGIPEREETIEELSKRLGWG